MVGGVDSALTAREFVASQRQLMLPNLSASCCLLEYRTAHFHPSLFTAHGIVCPHALLASVPQRRAEFLAGRLAVQAAAGYLHLPMVRVGMGQQRQPLWPEGLSGSISHDRGRTVAAVSLSPHAIGLDIVPDLDQQSAELLLPAVACADEFNLLQQALPHWREDDCVALLFSAKESLYKALFPRVGRVFDFLDVTLDSVDGQCRSLQLLLTTTLSSRAKARQGYQVFWQLIDGGQVTYCTVLG